VTANDWICVDGDEAAARVAHRLSEVIAIYPITPARPPPTTRPAAERVDVAFLLTAAVVWSIVTWWKGLPSSSSHALVGGLVGAALAISPVIGFGGAWLMERGAPRPAPGHRPHELARAPGAVGHLGVAGAQPRRQRRPEGGGVLAVLLLANGSTTSLSAPVWATLACAAALTMGTALGGWRIVKTIGRRIFRIRPLDGLVSQTSSAAVILAASVVSAPASTTQVVSSSVVGVGWAATATAGGSCTGASPGSARP
jgi:inorganic phosphate transporter, PiT family